MKSAGNGGVVQSRLQVLHVHVFLAAQLGARRVAKSGADQHQGGVPVRECPHHTGAAADLTVQPLDHVVGTDAGPMLAGKIAVGQRFLCTIFSDIVCCLLSEWCVVTSFYQSLQAMSSFMRFSICASYFTLSNRSSIIDNVFRTCIGSRKCSSYRYSSISANYRPLMGKYKNRCAVNFDFWQTDFRISIYFSH